MQRRADQPRWHTLVRRTATPALVVILFFYGCTMYVGFIAKGASGPIFLARPGAVGVGYLDKNAVIQDIPPTDYVGLYFPTAPPIWKVLVRDDLNGVRVYLPYWIPLGIIAGLMAWVKFAGRPRPFGVCPGCGYNLTGSVTVRCEHCGITAATCPECGAKVAKRGERVEETPSTAEPAEPASPAPVSTPAP